MRFFYGIVALALTPGHTSFPKTNGRTDSVKLSREIDGTDLVTGAREVEKSVEVLQRGRSSVNEERERFFSRLATIPGVRTMPSIGSWILVKVDNPADVARKVNRRFAAGTASVPRHVAGAVRLPVRDPKRNEELFQTIRDLFAAGLLGL